MDLEEKIAQFERLCQDLNNNYQVANELIKDICYEAPDYLNLTNFQFLSMFDSILPEIAMLLEASVKNDQINQKTLAWLYYVLFRIYLKLALFNKSNFYLKKLNEINKQYDFNPDIITDLLFENKEICVEYDKRLDESLCSYLCSELDNCLNNLFSPFYPKARVYLLNGKGPSPFDPSLKTIYLNCGHYSKTEHDKEILTTAIIHEFTHFDIYRNTCHFSKVNKQFGLFKLFDEGLAQYNSFNQVKIQSNMLYESDFASYVFINYSPKTFKIITDNWLSILFEEKNFPLYEFSHSFITYLINQYQYKAVLTFLQSWLNKDNHLSLDEHYLQVFKKSLEGEFENWILHIQKNTIVKNNLDFVISNVMHNKSVLSFSYDSALEIWPEKQIFAIQKNKQIYLTSSNEKRYQKQGNISINTDSDQIELFICAKGQNRKLNINNKTTGFCVEYDKI